MKGKSGRTPRSVRMGGRFIAVTISALCVLTGCTQADVKENKSVTVEQDMLLSREEKAMLEYLQGKMIGTATEKDYLNVAKLFSERRKICDQRNALEECILQFDSQEAITELEQVWVNLEEEPELLADARNMYQGMRSPNLEEAVGLLAGKEWLSKYAPRVYQAGRNYFLQEDGRIILCFTVRYGEDG